MISHPTSPLNPSQRLPEGNIGIGLPPLLQLAQDTASCVARICKIATDCKKKGLVVTLIKPDGSKVTNGDIDVSKAFISDLPKIFPAKVLTEEIIDSFDFGTFQLSEPLWIVDPIDSTSSYDNGSPGYCLMCSLVQNGEQILAVVAGPEQDEIYMAAKGQGAFKSKISNLNFVPITAREALAPNLKVAKSFNTKPEHEKLILDALKPLGFDNANSTKLSSGLKCCYLAEGLFDVAISIPRFYAWDAIPALIVREAGGHFLSTNNFKFDPTALEVGFPLALGRNLVIPHPALK